MKNVFCTLFDSNYLDKGLTMIWSLLKECIDTEIYVLCMDERCHEILQKERTERTNVISLEQFVDEDLKNIMGVRKRGEFCWSCTGKLIKYVLEHCDADTCTYVDADMFFYSNPIVVIDEMISGGASVQVVPHRFPGIIRRKVFSKENGINCVQFNTFGRTIESMNLLNSWIDSCIKECSVESVGDQKYTSDWGFLPFVNSSKNIGAGVASWNVSQYKLVEKNDSLEIKDRKKGSSMRMVFYHFENINYLSRQVIQVHCKDQAFFYDRELIDTLYGNYLVDIDNVKTYLEKKYAHSPIYSHEGVIKNIKNEPLSKRIKYVAGSSFFELLVHIYVIVLKKIRRKKTFYNLNDLKSVYSGYLGLMTDLQ